MEQELEVQAFDFSVVPADKRERAIELDTQCGDAIQKLSYTVDEICEICSEMKEILPHGYFIPWYSSKGLTQNQIAYAAKRARERKQSALDIIEINDFHLFDAPEQASIPERAASTEKDRKLAELEEKVRIANERLFSVESSAAYYKEQATIAQAQAAHPPQVIEKRVEVTPQYVIERGRELQAQKTQLQTQLEQIRKERDLYKRDLDKERQNGNATFLQGLESSGTTRLRANFAESMREIVAWSRSSTMKLPSVVDTQVLEAEEWQRLEEAIQANEALGQALRRVKHTPSSMQQSFIIDADLVTR